MSRTLALRGATTFDEDVREHVRDRVVGLLTEMLARNSIAHDDLISILFTATEELTCAFPAEVARSMGLGDVPLICARELSIVGATPRCIRILMHFEGDVARSELRHVYLEGAAGLRDDLPE